MNWRVVRLSAQARCLVGAYRSIAQYKPHFAGNALGRTNYWRHKILSRPPAYFLPPYSIVDMSSLLCAICLDTLQTKTALSTTCGHIFCSECAKSHFTTRPTCPVCRKVQTFEQLIRLFPEYGTASHDADRVSTATSGLRRLQPPSSVYRLRSQLHQMPLPQRSRNPQLSDLRSPSYGSVSSLRIQVDPTGTRFPWTQAGIAPVCDLDGSPVFLGLAEFRDGLHPCKIRVEPQGRPVPFVSYGGKEYEHRGTTFLLPFDPATMLSVRASHGQLPRGSRPVEGGYERIDAQKLYHALAVVNGVSVPGKAGENGHMVGGCLACRWTA